MKKRHDAYYGVIKLERMFCKSCKCMTLVNEGIKLCCNNSTTEENDKNIKEYVCQPLKRRLRLPKKVKKEILDLQSYKCIYCAIRFGHQYFYRGKKRYAKINFDHFEPFIFGYDNRPQNIVAACHHCNNIKGSLLFDTFEDAQRHIISRRIQKGLPVYANVTLEA